MKKLENPYSRFRYDNTFDLKCRIDPLDNQITTFGADQRAFKYQIKKQIDGIAPCLNLGNTWVVDNVYKVTQITNVDTPVVNDPNAKRLTFFRLFKL